MSANVCKFFYKKKYFDVNFEGHTHKNLYRWDKCI